MAGSCKQQNVSPFASLVNADVGQCRRDNFPVRRWHGVLCRRHPPTSGRATPRAPQHAIQRGFRLKSRGLFPLTPGRFSTWV